MARYLISTSIRQLEVPKILELRALALVTFSFLSRPLLMGI